jgi:hypothetical protein
VGRVAQQAAGTAGFTPRFALVIGRESNEEPSDRLLTQTLLTMGAPDVPARRKRDDPAAQAPDQNDQDCQHDQTKDCEGCRGFDADRTEGRGHVSGDVGDHPSSDDRDDGDQNEEEDPTHHVWSAI